MKSFSIVESHIHDIFYILQITLVPYLFICKLYVNRRSQEIHQRQQCIILPLWVVRQDSAFSPPLKWYAIDAYLYIRPLIPDDADELTPFCFSRLVAAVSYRIIPQVIKHIPLLPIKHQSAAAAGIAKQLPQRFTYLRLVYLVRIGILGYCIETKIICYFNVLGIKISQ